MDSSLSPLAVANHFLKKGFEEGVSLSNLKLQKLVYIAHGYFLAINTKPLIDEAIEVWQYGPVIDSLYHKFKRYGNRPITRLGKELLIQNGQVKDILPDVTDEDNKKLLDTVWDRYKDASALELSSMTHQENTPWWQAKKENRVQVPQTYIRQYYTDKMEEYRKSNSQTH